MAHLKPSLCQPNKNGIPPDRNPPTAIQGSLTIYHFPWYSPRAFLGRSKPRRHLRLQPFLHKTYLQCLSHFFYHIRQLRQARSSLDKNSAIILANAIVSSKFDYCNSLYFNLPKSSLKRFQRVQNSLARAVVPSTHYTDHITPTLRKLHWLPIDERITFKIASLTYKTLNYKQPTYLLELLHPVVPTRTLRSSTQQLLKIPAIKSQIGRRSFSFSAPTVWNSLPLSLRSSPSLDFFLSRLKTHLFPP